MQFSHKIRLMSNYPLSDQSYQQKYQEFLRRLKAARIDAGLTQQEVAQTLGTNQSFISRSEQGNRRVDIIELQAFAWIYQKPLTYFTEIE